MPSNLSLQVVVLQRPSRSIPPHPCYHCLCSRWCASLEALWAVTYHDAETSGDCRRLQCKDLKEGYSKNMLLFQQSQTFGYISFGQNCWNSRNYTIQGKLSIRGDIASSRWKNGTPTPTVAKLLGHIFQRSCFSTASCPQRLIEGITSWSTCQLQQLNLPASLVATLNLHCELDLGKKGIEKALQY